MQANYVNSTQFTVSGNKVDEFTVGRRIKADCGSDGYRYATVQSSSYSSPSTTVTIHEGTITSNLVGVLYGIVNIGASGSFPAHAHDGSEGQGGRISLSNLEDRSFTNITDRSFTYVSDRSFLNLSDTPSSFSSGKYLQSSSEDLDWGLPNFIDLNDTPTSYSGTEGYCLKVGDSDDIIFETPQRWEFGNGVPSLNAPAIKDDLYMDKETGLLYSRNSDSETILIEDAFTGSTLNSSKWGTYTAPNASVSVDNELQLNNQTGSAHSGAHCYSKDEFSKSGIIVLTCKWKPHSNHYSTAARPHIKFTNLSSTRDSSYGARSQRFMALHLSGQYDTTNRTVLAIADAGVSGDWEGTTRAIQNIDIVEDQWHNLEITVDCSSRLFTVDLDDGAYNFSATIDSSSWSSIGDNFVLEFSNPDYNKNNTEAFKDVKLVTTGYDVAWSVVTDMGTTFTGLTDTPPTYSGIEGQYLKTTSSGVTTTPHIILVAPDSSTWVLKVTNSGTLYTEAYGG